MPEGDAAPGSPKREPPSDEAAAHRAQGTVTVCNRKGLHARASAQFVRVSEQFGSEIYVTCNGEEASATSILDLMMLAAGPGVELQISATGSDAQDAVAALTALVADGFGEGDPVEPGQ